MHNPGRLSAPRVFRGARQMSYSALSFRERLPRRFAPRNDSMECRGDFFLSFRGKGQSPLTWESHND